MIILESKKYNVYMFEDINSTGSFEYIVKYGLQLTRCETVQNAVTEFNSCIQHSMECNGECDND